MSIENIQVQLQIDDETVVLMLQLLRGMIYSSRTNDVQIMATLVRAARNHLLDKTFFECEEIVNQTEPLTSLLSVATEELMEEWGLTGIKSEFDS